LGENQSSQYGKVAYTAFREDITKCQKDHNKTIILSLGGDAATFDFGSAEKAAENAQDIWNMFGPKNTTSGAKRPFGDAAVNGFDLDIEGNAKYIVNWTNSMRHLIGDSHYLSAAPQCPAPETNPLKELLEGAKFDIFFVQYYNNPNCAYEGRNIGGSEYNHSLAEWDKWAMNNGTRFFLGLPAGPSAVTSGGYLNLTDMKAAVGDVKAKESFGGVMLWDVSQAWGNGNYHAEVRKELNEGST
jgi:chitinase